MALIEMPSGERRNLDKPFIIIGRDASCDLSFPGSADLRGQHATMRKIANRWMIESQGDWLVQVDDAQPMKMSWLIRGSRIRLTANGPEIVFEPLVRRDPLAMSSQTPDTPNDSGNREPYMRPENAEAGSGGWFDRLSRKASDVTSIAQQNAKKVISDTVPRLEALCKTAAATVTDLNQKARLASEAVAPKLAELKSVAGVNIQNVNVKAQAVTDASAPALNEIRNAAAPPDQFGGKKAVIAIVAAVVLVAVIVSSFRSRQRADSPAAQGGRPSDLVERATAQAEQLLPKVKEINDRSTVLLEYRNRISKCQQEIRRQMDIIGVDELGVDEKVVETITNGGTLEEMAEAHKRILLQLDPTAILKGRHRSSTTFNKVLELRKLLCEIGDPEDALNQLKASQVLLDEVRPATVALVNGVFNALAMPPTPAGLVRIAGETHLIDGNSYYIENRIISIPEKYKNLYLQQSLGPNQKILVGDFRFIKNTTGTNALGAQINVEMYECDSEFSDAQLKVVELQSNKSILQFKQKIDWGEVSTDLSNQADLMTFYERLFGAGAIQSPSPNAYMKEFEESRAKLVAPVQAAIDGNSLKFKALIAKASEEIENGDIKGATESCESARELFPDDPSIPIISPLPIPPSAKSIVYLCEQSLDETSYSLDVAMKSALALRGKMRFGFVELCDRRILDSGDRWSAFQFTPSLVAPSADLLLKWQNWETGSERGIGDNRKVGIGGIEQGVKAAFDLQPDLLVVVSDGHFPRNDSDVKLLKTYNASGVRVIVVNTEDIGRVNHDDKPTPLLQSIADQNHGFVVQIHDAPR